MSAKDDFLPPFRSSTSVDEENAMVDRLQLEIGDWVLRGVSDDIMSVLNYLGSYITVSTSSLIHVPLFAPASVRSLNYRVNVDISQGGRGASAYSAKPIFSGSLMKAGRRRDGYPNIPRGQVRLAFRCNLNPTRFLLAQRYTVTRSASRSRPITPYAFAIRRERRWGTRELPLMPATNVVLGNAYPFGYLRRLGLEDHCRIFLDETYNLLAAAITEPMRSEGVSVAHGNYRSLSACEIYWEFSDPNPIGLVAEITPSLMRLSALCSVRHQVVEDIREGLDRDSLVVSIKFSHEVWLRVYAKTNLRIRLEFVFKHEAIHSIARGQTCGENASVVSKISTLKHWAIGEMNWVLSELHRRVPEGVRQETVVGLLSRIVGVLQDRGGEEAVVASLQTYGRLAPQGNAPMLALARALREAGVLRPLRRGSPIYVVTDEYEAALRDLCALNSRQIH